jgi:peptidyl-prolyl cis-trans isomerase C
MHAQHTHRRHDPTPVAMPAVAVDGVAIPESDIAAEMQHQPAPSRDAAWQAAAQALVVRQLLLAEAARRGFFTEEAGGDETPEEAAARRLLEAEITVPEADEATLRRWHGANRARCRSPELWHVQHILVAADPEDAAATEAAAAKAQALLEAVLAEPARLPGLARDNSDCSSRGEGGDLGQVEPGSTVAEFEAALRATPAGAVHPAVVRSRYGAHVVRVLAHAPGRDLPFEAMRERIAGHLRGTSWRRAVHQYISILAGRARIEGVALSAAADSPLVQ